MNRILVGVSTIFGILGSVALYATSLIEPLQQQLEPLGISPQTYMYASVILGGLVIVSRGAQEIAAIIRTGMTDGERKAAETAVLDAPGGLVDAPPSEPTDAPPTGIVR